MRQPRVAEPAPHDADVVIAGGGLTGMALAIALARGGSEVTMIEQAPLAELIEPQHDGRVTAIALGSQRFLDAIGLWPAIAPHAEPILQITVAEAGSPVSVHYDHREVGPDPLGWIVENRAIRLAQQTVAATLPSLRVLAPARIEALAAGPGAITLDLDTGATLRAALLAVCDGRQSPTRKLAGIGVTSRPYGQTGIVGTLAHERPHHNVAIERFWPDGPFAILPMQGNRSSIVWALDSDRAALLKPLDAAAFASEVAERFGDVLGPLRLDGRRWQYPLSLVEATAFTAPRVALVGDAARGLHPIAGQGWNLAVRDVAALADIVVDRQRLGLDIGDANALDRYTAWRRFDALALVSITDGITRLFSNDLKPLKLARNLGLGLVERLPPAKRFFMRHAMGLIGELPKAMRRPLSGERRSRSGPAPASATARYSQLSPPPESSPPQESPPES